MKQITCSSIPSLMSCYEGSEQMKPRQTSLSIIASLKEPETSCADSQISLIVEKQKLLSFIDMNPDNLKICCHLFTNGQHGFIQTASS